MKTLRKIFDKITELESSGRSYALATVVRVSGSTYRGHGARMLICDDGEMIGTISGGCLEGDVYTRAQEAMKTGQPQFISYDTTSEDDIYWGTGMGCGGVTEVFISAPKSGSAESDTFLKIGQHLQYAKPIVVGTIFSAPSLHQSYLGTSIVFSGQNEENSLPPKGIHLALLNEAMTVMKEKKSRTLNHALPGGDLQVLLEYIAPPLPLVIFGGDHDVFPMITAGRRLGWDVTVVERREALATVERFPEAHRVVFWQDGEMPETLRINESTISVIMTHHYLTDKMILRRLLKSDCRYLGFLGPKKRANQVLNELRDEGMKIGEAELSRLYHPVGLDIGAETAEEVALAIVAEILAVINGRNGGLLRERKGHIHDRKIDEVTR